MLSLTREQRAFVDHVVEGVPFLSFNDETGHFEMDDDQENASWDVVARLVEALRRLRFGPEQPFFLPPVRLDQIRTGFPDRCLEHHAHQLLDLKVSELETCWMRNGVLLRCVGRLEAGGSFDEEEKRRFLEALGGQRDRWNARMVHWACRENPALVDRLAVDDEGWILFHARLEDMPVGWTARQRNRLGLLARRLVGREPRVYRFVRRVQKHARKEDWAREARHRLVGHRDIRPLVRSIEEHGWDNERARAEGWPGLLGFSRRTGTHHVISGRHRIAALRYLLAKGKIDGATPVEYAVISYPWRTWIQCRPHPALDLCSLCRSDASGSTACREPAKAGHGPGDAP